MLSNQCTLPLHTMVNTVWFDIQLIMERYFLVFALLHTVEKKHGTV